MKAILTRANNSFAVNIAVVGGLVTYLVLDAAYKFIYVFTMAN